MLARIWSWLRARPWLVLPVLPMAVGWLWRWLRGPQAHPEVTGPTLTPDQAEASRDRIQDARDRKMGEIEHRWDDLREKWLKYNGQPKDPK